MGKHAKGSPPVLPAMPPLPPPRPSRRRLRAEYERLHAQYAELAGDYRELLEAALTAAQRAGGTRPQAAWDRAARSLEQDTTEEIPAPVDPLKDTAFSWGRS